MQALPNTLRKFHWSLISIQLDGAFRSVQDNPATVTTSQVFLEALAKLFLKFTVNVKVQFLDHLFAVHLNPSPFPLKKSLHCSATRILGVIMLMDSRIDRRAFFSEKSA
jgi:hypothetical protein